jgi:hypothetical protein
MQYI